MKSSMKKFSSSYCIHVGRSWEIILIKFLSNSISKDVLTTVLLRTIYFHALHFYCIFVTGLQCLNLIKMSCKKSENTLKIPVVNTWENQHGYDPEIN